MAKSRADLDTKLVRRLKSSIEHHLTYTLGCQDPDTVSDLERYTAVVCAIKEQATDALNATDRRVRDENGKRVYYLSMEFLIGRLLANNLHNLGIYSECANATQKLGFELADILETELDPALGNGGLGRLAACFLDSMATIGIPGYGYGINYEYGLFRQSFVDGTQREHPDHWMIHGSPWQTERSFKAIHVPVYGRVDHTLGSNGQYHPVWVDWDTLVGVPHDMPVVGYGGETVNYLRLYSARSSDSFDMEIFNQGDYINAVQQKIQTETVSKVLYPSDSIEAGKELRLIQEYFFVACALRDILRQHEEVYALAELPNQVAIQLNDTHPALAVVELMRILIDEKDLQWDTAWDITTRTLAFTNHTLLPEALEKWPVELIKRVLPRHLELIYEVNRRFLDQVRNAYPGDDMRLRKMSIIEEEPIRQVRMANLSIVGSHSVNGVAALHTELLKAELVPEFDSFYPKKFNNKTNGVTQRRWLMACNPGLSDAIEDAIGDDWVTNLFKLRDLERLQSDSAFLEHLSRVKHANKEALANYIFETTRINVNPASIFDVQIKRIHEYKRQLLNALHIAHLYFAIVEDGHQLQSPRTFVFSGKAAPGYYIAKLIIKFINNLATIIN
ncbi:MAG: glycogen/starch/alpha-glucan family phosphorylase, partial [Pseudomonadota bacterium]